MLAGAVRTYLNRYAVLAGRRVVVCTTNDSAYATALDLLGAGAEVLVADTRAAGTRRRGRGARARRRGAGRHWSSAPRAIPR